MKVKPWHVDGALYVLVVMCLSVLSSLSTDAAKEFVSPATMFWSKTLATAISAGSITLKAFRSKPQWPQPTNPENLY